MHQVPVVSDVTPLVGVVVPANGVVDAGYRYTDDKVFISAIVGESIVRSSKYVADEIPSSWMAL